MYWHELRGIGYRGPGTECGSEAGAVLLLRERVLAIGISLLAPLVKVCQAE
jgi:hypothetical protein